MGGFHPTWLALREPLDHAARDRELLRRATALLERQREPVVVDLGCGSGSNGRALAPRLGPGQRWRLVDGDRALLAEAERQVPGAVEPILADLGAVDALPLDGAHLVTASAVFDLASDAWLERLTARLAVLQLPLYAALTYDGRIEWAPAHRLDEPLRAALNAHQRTDKGLGPALGPAATGRLAGLLTGRGYAVEVAPSPWRAGPAHAALQRRVADVMAAAATELGTLPAAELAAWRTFRQSAAAAGRLVLGHKDLLAVPGAT
ncbi:MAG TPA: class I SAM-dependent methyltransferase [Azospirillum sp.]|nr:class I SAM-dependent methyltransferase [Azospirillum sp.]